MIRKERILIRSQALLNPLTHLADAFVDSAMSEDTASSGSSSISSPVGLVTQSPLAFALILVGLYWAHKVLRGVDSSRPPRAPYWIPWVGSAVEIGKDPDGFFNGMTCVLPSSIAR